MARLIGIEDVELQNLIVEAYKRGFAEATAEAKATTGEWLKDNALGREIFSHINAKNCIKENYKLYLKGEIK